MKISFDFDSTLSIPYIQDVAISLVKRGFDIYITTSRYETPIKWGLRVGLNNDDLFFIADKCGILKDNIRFTNMEDKYTFLEDFQIHLDDDWIELNLINKNTKCVGISVFGNVGWKNKLKKQIENYEKSND